MLALGMQRWQLEGCLGCRGGGGSSIDVVGFCFLDLATEYKPPPELDAFLKEGPPPVFVGFGSLVRILPFPPTSTKHAFLTVLVSCVNLLFAFFSPVLETD